MHQHARRPHINPVIPRFHNSSADQLTQVRGGDQVAAGMGDVCLGRPHGQNGHVALAHYGSLFLYEIEAADPRRWEIVY